MTARISALLGSCILLVTLTAASPAQDAAGNRGAGAEPSPTPPSVLLPSHAQHGYLGLSVDLVAPEVNTVYVLSVVAGGPADKAGLKANDVIVQVDRQPIRDLDDLDRMVLRPPGTRLQFEVRRHGTLQSVPVVLGQRPKEPTRAAGEKPAIDELPPPPPPVSTPKVGSSVSPSTDATRAASGDTAEGEVPAGRAGSPTIVQGSRPILGISVADISDLTRRRFGVTVDAGAVISNIREGTPAALAGLPLGGVIVSINGQRIGSANDIVNVIQSFRPGEEVEVTYFEGDRAGRKRIRLGRSAVAVVPKTPAPKGAGRRRPPSLR